MTWKCTPVPSSASNAERKLFYYCNKMKMYKFPIGLNESRTPQLRVQANLDLHRTGHYSTTIPSLHGQPPDFTRRWNQCTFLVSLSDIPTAHQKISLKGRRSNSWVQADLGCFQTETKDSAISSGFNLVFGPLAGPITFRRAGQFHWDKPSQGKRKTEGEDHQFQRFGNLEKGGGKKLGEQDLLFFELV